MTRSRFASASPQLTWSKQGNHIYGATLTIPGARYPRNALTGQPSVSLRVDGRDGTYRVDVSDIQGWTAIDEGQGFATAREAQQFAQRWVKAAANPFPTRPPYTPNPGPKPLTFRVAQDRILQYLSLKGWGVRGALKTPRAISPDGQTHLWFRAQAVYASTGKYADINNARPLWIDIRNVTPQEFERTVNSLEDGPRYARNPEYPMLPPAGSLEPPLFEPRSLGVDAEPDEPNEAPEPDEFPEPDKFPSLPPIIEQLPDPPEAPPVPRKPQPKKRKVRKVCSRLALMPTPEEIAPLAKTFEEMRQLASKHHPDVIRTGLAIDPAVHDTPRRFGMAGLGRDGPIIKIAPQLVRQPKTVQRGILGHELGHVLQMLGSTMIEAGDELERDADRLAEEIFGEPIFYTENSKIQCMGPRAKGIRPRPEGLS